ncbi:hypothetical protein [Thiolapillus sp.]
MRRLFPLLVLLLPLQLASAWELSGYIEPELRLFADAGLQAGQERTSVSLAIQPELAHEQGNHQFVFTPFVRIDQQDDERTHVDVRELYWLYAGDDWELQAGISRVFWGVTESQHLVDIINQIDLVENPDGEDKLGQPMIRLSLVRDWGIVDAFLLPGFRERAWPGEKGRLRYPLVVDNDAVRYESGQKQRHVDWALRWTQSWGDWEIGVAHFSGTSREPLLSPGVGSGGNVVLIPYYPLIEQTSLDLQAIKGDWLWKLEAISRNGMGAKSYSAATAGFEYTLVGVNETAIDVGLVVEYLWDERGSDALTPFQHDVMAGVRISFNDEQSTEALLGLITDLEYDSSSFSIEASRRLYDSFKLSVEIRFFDSSEPRDLAYGFRSDDYLQMGLAWYF